MGGEGPALLDGHLRIWLLYFLLLIPIAVVNLGMQFLFEPEARQAMFEELLPSIPREAEGCSGSDIRLVCTEAAMQPLRRLMSFLEHPKELVPQEELPAVGPVTPQRY